MLGANFQRRCLVWFSFLLVLMCHRLHPSVQADDLRLATFVVDASPKIGSPLAYDPTREVTMPLSCRGIVLLGSGQPIVLCAVDWIGISNEANEMLCNELAKAAGTTSDRVVVHTLHQHDAPRADLTAYALLKAPGRGDEFYDVGLLEQVAKSASVAIAEAIPGAKKVIEVGIGQAEVHGVASNRRILDADGRVVVTRFTACQDPKIRELPAGVIDPMLRTIIFFGEELPIAALTYYATHPQSYYRTGQANPDFPGMARNARQEVTGVVHVHFNGAGGNIGAGKYNDGSKPNRHRLAEKMEDGMRAAWDAVVRHPIKAKDVAWQVEPVALPVSNAIDVAALTKLIEDASTPASRLINATEQVAFAKRMADGHKIRISCLRLGNDYVLHMPGELFVEYQIAASQLRPDANVMMAAYGDYGPFYIGTRAAYPQGGYEVGATASNVAPEAEEVLMDAVAKLLHVENRTIHASDFTDRFGPGAPPQDPASK